MPASVRKFLLSVSLAGLVGGCSGSPTESTFAQVVDMDLHGTSPLLGASAQYTAIALFSDGHQEDVTQIAAWETSSRTVATVDRGLVTGLALGTAVVSARYAGFTGSTNVTVTSNAVAHIQIRFSSGTYTATFRGVTMNQATGYNFDLPDGTYTVNGTFNLDSSGFGNIFVLLDRNGPPGGVIPGTLSAPDSFLHGRCDAQWAGAGPSDRGRATKPFSFSFTVTTLNTSPSIFGFCYNG